MRTKIILSAALVAAGIAAADAQQVYSVNAVGYVNVTIKPGYNLLANPLNGTNNVISTIIPTAPEGTAAFKWNSVSQSFTEADYYFVGNGWLDGNFAPSTNTLSPGEGFFLQNNSGGNVTITFVGEVPQGSLTNRISSNYGFYGSQVPQSAGLTALGFPASEGMAYTPWNATGQAYAPGYSYISGVWYDDNFANVEPVPAVAEGFLITNPGAAVNWSRTFSVNN
jgi:hypothetical protein